MSDLVHAYWAGALRRLQAEVHGLSKLVEHAGEQGRENELALARMLTALVPRRFGTGSGLLIDSRDGQSPQVDIVIYELATESTLFAQTTQLLFPVEATYACVEVKTTLRSDDVAEFGPNARAIRQLSSLRTHADDTQHPVKCLFAYSAWASPKTVLKHVLTIPYDDRPDLFCVVDQGLVGGRADLLGNFGGDEAEGYRAGVACRLERDSAGNVQVDASGAYEVSHTQQAADIYQDGVMYKSLRVAAGDFVLVDSARGLLLFLELLLGVVHRKVDATEPLLSLYMTDAMRSVLLIPPPSGDAGPGQ